jgi:hypothetical protein
MSRDDPGKYPGYMGIPGYLDKGGEYICPGMILGSTQGTWESQTTTLGILGGEGCVVDLSARKYVAISKLLGTPSLYMDMSWRLWTTL